MLDPGNMLYTEFWQNHLGITKSKLHHHSSSVIFRLFTDFSPLRGPCSTTQRPQRVRGAPRSSCPKASRSWAACGCVTWAPMRHKARHELRLAWADGALVGLGWPWSAFSMGKALDFPGFSGIFCGELWLNIWLTMGGDQQWQVIFDGELW